MLMEKELKYLKGAVDSPVRPMACIVGGAKVSSKVSTLTANPAVCYAIENLPQWERAVPPPRSPPSLYCVCAPLSYWK